MKVHPRAFAIAILLTVCGTLLMNELRFLLVGLLLIGAPVLLWKRRLLAYLRLGAFTIGPVVLGLLIVWGVVVGAPPGATLHSAPAAGVVFALTVATRLTLISALFYATLAAESASEVRPLLRGWGLSGDALAVVMGAIVLVPELAVRVQQVVTARYARGLFGRAHPLDRVRHLPYLLRPLIGWSLRSAIQRSELWQHRSLVARLSAVSSSPPTRLIDSMAVLLIGSGWAVLGVLSALHLR